jgi:hypothetical protein
MCEAPVIVRERRAEWKAPEPCYERGYWMFTRHIRQANEGCDFEFLETGFGAPVDEPAIFRTSRCVWPSPDTIRTCDLSEGKRQPTLLSSADGN